MKTIQVRNVPDDVHRRLKARAAMEGRSLSELALRELTRSLAKPSMDQWLARLATREPFEISGGAVRLVQESREERERELFRD